MAGRLTRRLTTLAAGTAVLAAVSTGCGIIGPPPSLPPPSQGAQPAQGAAPGTASGATGGNVVGIPGAQPQAAIGGLLGIPAEIAFNGCIPQTVIGTVAVARVAARVSPSPSARTIAVFGSRNVEGSPQTFDILRQVTGAGGRAWGQALLPLRPNGTTGYIPLWQLRLSWTNFWLEVDRHNLRLTLWQGCNRLREYPVGIGTGSTPTPVGRFYLAALIKPPTPYGPYGVCAYGLSAYSDVIKNWRWGGVIGLHGTDEPVSVGHFVSHGCIRMYNQDISQLGSFLPLGTPIVIH